MVERISIPHMIGWENEWTRDDWSREWVDQRRRKQTGRWSPGWLGGPLVLKLVVLSRFNCVRGRFKRWSIFFPPTTCYKNFNFLRRYHHAWFSFIGTVVIIFITVFYSVLRFFIYVTVIHCWVVKHTAATKLYKTVIPITHRVWGPTRSLALAGWLTDWQTDWLTDWLISVTLINPLGASNHIAIHLAQPTATVESINLNPTYRSSLA